MNGPTWGTGKISGGVNFDGYDDVLYVRSSNFNFTGDVTISAWFNQALYAGQNQATIVSGADDALAPKFILYLDRPNKRVCISSVQVVNCTPFNSYTTVGQWTHITLVRPANGQNVTVYINGVPKGSVSIGTPIAAPRVTIGRLGLNTSRFAGVIDEVRIYTRQLAATEIPSLLTSSSSPPPSSTALDLDLSATLASLSVVQGSSVSNTITSSLIQVTAQLEGDTSLAAASSPTLLSKFASAIAQLSPGASIAYALPTDPLILAQTTASPVSFSVTGLPLNTTASFSAASCTPNCNTTLTLRTTASTPAGTYTISVKGTSSDDSDTATFKLTVNQAPSTPTPPPPPPPPPPTTTTSTCDTGTADAPCAPANKRIVVVAQDGTGQHRDLNPALLAAQPGDTIQIKNGTYSCPAPCPQGYWLYKSGTRELPIAIVNYPGHRPKLTVGIISWGAWVLIEGLEITQTTNGIVLYYYPTYNQVARHTTIRKNWIHNTGFMGIYTSGLSHLLVEQNVIERAGLGPADCTTDWGSTTHSTIYKYAHCHGMYINNSTGTASLPTPTTNVTIRRNKFISNAGMAWGNRTDGVRSTNYLIENNLLLNNSLNQGFIDMDKSVIRNNTIVQFSFAKPNEAHKTCYYSNHNTSNIIANNVCYTSLNPAETSVKPVHSWRADSTIGNTWTNNAFFARPGTQWYWGGNLVENFLATYAPTTQDSAPVLQPVTVGNGSEAGFVDALGGNFDLGATSPLIGTGNASYCPTVDIDGLPRAKGTCDIGAYAR
ncbi:MAG: hypothetical protein FJ147_25120 [Deltaproteobacteria bacterium]|nr:hypothetical protein [Deltaproteobacteria bacterium]